MVVRRVSRLVPRRVLCGTGGSRTRVPVRPAYGRGSGLTQQSRGGSNHRRPQRRKSYAPNQPGAIAAGPTWLPGPVVRTVAVFPARHPAVWLPWRSRWTVRRRDPDPWSWASCVVPPPPEAAWYRQRALHRRVHGFHPVEGVGLLAARGSPGWGDHYGVVGLRCPSLRTVTPTLGRSQPPPRATLLGGEPFRSWGFPCRICLPASGATGLWLCMTLPVAQIRRKPIGRGGTSTP